MQHDLRLVSKCGCGWGVSGWEDLMLLSQDAGDCPNVWAPRIRGNVQEGFLSRRESLVYCCKHEVEDCFTLCLQAQAKVLNHWTSMQLILQVSRTQGQKSHITCNYIEKDWEPGPWGLCTVRHIHFWTIYSIQLQFSEIKKPEINLSLGSNDNSCSFFCQIS